jgi:hypothetical protein
MNRHSVTVDLPALDFRAEVNTVNADDRTVEVKWSTGAGVRRHDYLSGVSYLEVLSLDKMHVRLDRLNNGAPVLNSHESDSLSRILGVVVEGSARVVGPVDARAQLRFSKRPDVEPFYQDVRDGIIRNVSVGYRVHKFEESRGKDSSLVRTAVDWEPFEISLVPMGADAGARLRGAPGAANPCVIVMRSDESDSLPPRIDQLIDEPIIDEERAFTLRLVEAYQRTPPPGLTFTALLESPDRIRLWECIRADALAAGDSETAGMMGRMIDLQQSDRQSGTW